MLNRLTMFMVLLLLAGVGGGRDIYVSMNGTNNPPYTNWPDAATNIEWAVNIAWNGDTVWISNGVYVLTNQITVRSNITICGTGGVTVVDGNNLTRCFDLYTTVQTSTLANLFITGGYKTNDAGGGVYMRYGTVRDCIFSNNVSLQQGGAMFCYRGTGITIQSCRFINNKGRDGGGLAMEQCAAALIDNCSFSNNIASLVGGGLYIPNGCSMIMTNCNFIDNIATNQSGGAFFSATGIVTHCTFVGNIAVNNRGGLFITYGVLSNSFVSNNVAANTAGGVRAQYGQIRNCIIARNIATNGSCGGAEISYGAMMQDCIVEGNSAVTYAGGVQLSSGGGTAQNCLIRNNIVSGASGKGGGVSIHDQNTFLISCTVVSNYATTEGGGFWAGFSAVTGHVENCIIYFNACGNPAYSNYYNACVNSSYSNCCVAPAITNAIVSNNITADPLFVDRAGGNYHLSANSPCVNSGVNRDWMINAVDLDGRIRIRYGTVDMGAYETIYNGTIYHFP